MRINKDKKLVACAFIEFIGEIIDSLAHKLLHLRFVHTPWITLSSLYAKKKQDTLKQYQEIYASKTWHELEQAHQYVSKMFDRCIDVAVLTYMLYGHDTLLTLLSSLVSCLLAAQASLSTSL